MQCDAGDMAQLVKCLLCKQSGMCLNLQHPHKKPGMGIWNHSAGVTAQLSQEPRKAIMKDTECCLLHTDARICTHHFIYITYKLEWALILPFVPMCVWVGRFVQVSAVTSEARRGTRPHETVVVVGYPVWVKTEL